MKTVDPTPGETVLEVGAGRGDLTGRLLEAGCAVIAVERDAHWSRALRQRFGADQRLAVVEGDVLEIPLPEEPYRAFGNVPFNLTTAILRRLLAPDNASMYRADLIVQWEVARKHASPVPRAVNSLIWQATFRFSILLRIPAASFRPIPSVDGALLAAVRRDVPLVDAAELPLFAGLVRTAFTGSGLLHANLRDFLAPKQMQHLRRELGIGPLTRASDLDAQQWAKLFHTSRASVPEERWSRLATDVHISAPPSRHRRRASDR